MTAPACLTAAAARRNACWCCGTITGLTAVRMMDMMTQDEMQAAVDALAVDMAAKGLRMPEARVSITSQSAPGLYARWAKPGERWADQLHRAAGNTIPDQIADARAWIADLPTPEERATREFQAALGSLIDLGRENGIAVDFLNPLTAMAKSLSENAITDQRVTK